MGGRGRLPLLPLPQVPKKSFRGVCVDIIKVLFKFRIPGYPVMVGYPMFPPSLPMVVPGTGNLSAKRLSLYLYVEGLNAHKM